LLTTEMSGARNENDPLIEAAKLDAKPSLTRLNAEEPDEFHRMAGRHGSGRERLDPRDSSPDAICLPELTSPVNIKLNAGVSLRPI
jgi:hypothetical protein